MPAKKKSTRSSSSARSGRSSATGKPDKPDKTPKPPRGEQSTNGGDLPPVVYANASPRSIGGRSMFDAIAPPSADDAAAYASEEPVVRAAFGRLLGAGFDVLAVSPHTINIAGPPSLYEEVFGARLFTEEREVIKGGAQDDTATFVESASSDLPGLIETAGTAMGDVIEGVAIEEPVYWMAPSAFAPHRNYWHLRVPGDVAAGVDAERAHRRGYTGRGVRVVMADSGWYRHPWFTRRGYRANPVVLGPAASNPEADESGHGTGESANIFSIAPDVEFTMVKMNFVNSLGSFNAAVALRPDIISCSWGSSIPRGRLSAANLALATAIAAAWRDGIVVVFSAGNGHWGFPGQHPDLISAGGVFMAEDESLRASDYTSGFASAIYQGRNVPDLSGLVGMQPGASYIMLPLEPGDQIDRGKAGGTHPPGDETPADDGWAAFSGTSAAAPQLAGVAALMKQACGELTPDEIRAIMAATATDVTEGHNHPNFNNPATEGYDLATGAGLVNANRAVLQARLKCLVTPPAAPAGVATPRSVLPTPPIVPPLYPMSPDHPNRPGDQTPPTGPPTDPLNPPPAGPWPSGGDSAFPFTAGTAGTAGGAGIGSWTAAVGSSPFEAGTSGARPDGPWPAALTREEAAALEEAILEGYDRGFEF